MPFALELAKLINATTFERFSATGLSVDSLSVALAASSTTMIKVISTKIPTTEVMMS